jgi:dolichyl-phosphate beta-glucosyltransferase
MIDLSIVMPAYNEEKKIHKDIEAVFEFFNESKISGELIIVNDGSKDNTFITASAFKEKYPNLKVLTYEKNRGKGYATKTGMLEAQGSFILLADAGLCVPYKYALSGIELLKQGNDIAIGSRRGDPNKVKIVREQPLYRKLGSKGFQLLIHLFQLIPPGIEDTQCGFKLFKKQIAHDVFNRLITEKFMWDIEVLRIAVKKKYKVVPFPVEWGNDPDSRFNPFIGSVENLWQIINIIIRT